MRKLLVLTDLDGTLLDHDTYSLEPARATVERLRELGWPLVLSSSKTAAEIRALRSDLNNGAPFVVENGAAVFVPRGGFDAQSGPESEIVERLVHGAPYEEIRALVLELREELRLDFVGFGDLDAKGVAELTGLDLEMAGLAKERTGSEPLLWRDDDEALESFTLAVEARGLCVTRGGRFVHVTGPTDKGRAVEWLRERYEAASPDASFTTVGLGDSENDRPLLEAVDIPVVVRKKHGESLRLEGRERVLYTSEAGPSGWAEAMDHLIERELALMEMEDG